MEGWKEEKACILKEYNQVKSELKQLQDHYKDVEREKIREKEVEAEIQAIKDAHFLHKKRMVEAARRIQIAYRAYKIRSSKKKKSKKKPKKN